MKQSIFYISDQTGITAELLGQTLLSQFDAIDYISQTLTYIDTKEKALAAVELINHSAQKNNNKPIIFSTIVQSDIKSLLHQSNAVMLDVFEQFISPLEQTFNTISSHRVGKQHGADDKEAYEHRIKAVNFALNTDDGLATQQYHQADIILIGVSRSGKTPTALYLAMQFDIMVANYPITEDDLEKYELAPWATQFKNKLFGLEIDTPRLQEIRTERHANSTYSSIKQCEFEVSRIKKLYRQENIPTINTTYRSIEEIATRIIAKAGLKR
ncbi:posphoenolpyruvate synthetase regulatory kinase/phosphorylase PpsR [sulfur-oxidizing endosymbiont of Gigantopelta aegis]|uniref:posphoenolpyruvate synthetase regulatory kinase/phosphorylase PpsR n=1 Tax=sulfur-oxidizing endosymbiont of Gigantopelta aegis TaxID=2794934 RepID=UPI0018DB8D74|nr:pyruvate, water dikinase regulatory protein [sulfur-oxidizing endosymbiont of Gigantopelta aegis]